MDLDSIFRFLMSNFDPLFTLAASIIGSFAGVFLGFYVEKRRKRKLDETLRSEYVKGLRLEIKEAIKRLKARNLHLISDYLWRCAVSSGDLQLFESDSREQLRQAYSAIDAYNYEAKRARDRGEQYDAEGFTAVRRKRLRSAWQRTSRQAKHMEKSTQLALEALLRQKWFRNP